MTRFCVLIAAILGLSGAGEAQMVIGTFSGSVQYRTSPTPINGYVAYVDLAGGNVQPVVTAPLVANSTCAQEGYAVALTSTVDFVEANSAIVLATNANLGAPQQTYISGVCGTPFGLLKSNGTYLSPIEIVMGTTGPSLLFSSNTSAMIGTPSQSQGLSAQWAVSGWTGSAGGGTALLVSGANHGDKAQPAAGEIAPRVGVGLTQDGATLILVMVNGVEASGVGLRLYDFADLLEGLGAWNAINLDGGGSSTFVYAPTGNIVRPRSLITLFDNARPVSGNPHGLTWKLTMAPANENCISYPLGNVTNPNQLCLNAPETGYRPVYSNLGFTLVAPNRLRKQ